MKSILIFLFLIINGIAIAETSCKKVKDVCVDKASTKEIEHYEIYRDCWKYQSVYKCHEKEHEDGCQELREQGCFMTSSECNREHVSQCVIEQKAFSCPQKNKLSSSEDLGCYTQIPCLHGDCFDRSYEPNNEMGSAIAQLSVLSAMQNEFEKEFDSLFKGTAESCTRAKFGFKNCCDGSKGWGVSLKLSQCQPENINTVYKSRQGLCHEVGTYCAEKWPLVGCVRRKKVFCCFSSKIIRAFQEGAHDQLGIGWGSPKNPSCQGLTIEQIQNIDFSKVDLSDALGDITSRYKAPDIKNIKEKLSQKMESLNQELNKKGGVKWPKR